MKIRKMWVNSEPEVYSGGCSQPTIELFMVSPMEKGLKDLKAFVILWEEQ